MKRRSGHLFKRGNVYYVRIVLNGKPIVKSTGETTVKEARKRQREIIHPFSLVDEARALQNLTDRLHHARADATEAVAAIAPGLTLHNAWDAYEKSQKRPDSGRETLRQYRVEWTRFVRWMQKKHPKTLLMAEVTATHAEAFIAQLRADRSAGTVNKYLAALALVFRVLREPGRIERNPFEGLPRLRAVQQGRRELTVEELRSVCAAATGEMRILFAVGLYSGLRLGDAATLRWSETDLERCLIRRIPNKTARRNPKPVLVPIHPSLRAVLSEAAAATRKPRPEFVMPGLASDYLRHSARLTRQVQKHFEACGIRTIKDGTGVKIEKDSEGKVKRVHTGTRAVVEVGFHSLRHSFVSLCRASGVSLAVVEEIVGHSNPAMTRHYTHTGEAAAIQAVHGLPCVLEGAAATGPGPQIPASLEERMKEITRLAKGVTEDTWQDVAGRILVLASGDEATPQQADRPALGS